MRAFGMWRVCTFYGVMAAVGLAALGRHALQVCFPAANAVAWSQAMSAGLAAGLALVVASRLAAAHLEWVRQLAGEFRNVMAGLTAPEALLLALCSGTSEEILFRGALQPALGLWLTALIFGVLHVGPTRRFIPWTVMALAAGLLFGALAEWTGSLLAPCVAHVTVNFLNLRFLAAGKRHIELSISPPVERAYHL